MLATRPKNVVGSESPGSEWSHTLQVVANLRRWPPTTPLVLLLGGSAAREGTTSDRAWQSQVSSGSGVRVTCFNLATSMQSYADDVGLVRALPRDNDIPLLVFIGISVGRYRQPPNNPTNPLPAPLPAPLTPLPVFTQHRYDNRVKKTRAQKQELADQWLSHSYPQFRFWYSYNNRELDSLVRTCLSLGIHPVLLELPVDPVMAGGTMKRPIQRYRRDTRKLARRYGVPWVSFAGKDHLKDRDFFDLWHLVDGPGRNKWQRMLSDTTVVLLRGYGL